MGTLSKEDAEVYLGRPKIVGRLREDWIKDRALLNWVADTGTDENGLNSTVRLRINTNSYSGYHYEHKAQRTFDRDTLVYTIEWKQSSGPVTV